MTIRLTNASRIPPVGVRGATKMREEWMIASGYRDLTMTGGEPGQFVDRDDGIEIGLPPAPRVRRASHDLLSQAQRWAIGLAVAAAIMPPYLYLFPWLIGQSSFVGVARVAGPIYVVSLVAAFVALIAAAIRLGVATSERVLRRGHPVAGQESGGGGT